MRYFYFFTLSLFLFSIQHTNASGIDWRGVGEPYIEFTENTHIHTQLKSTSKDIQNDSEDPWKHSIHGTSAIPQSDKIVDWFSQKIGKNIFEKIIISHANRNNINAFVHIFGKNYRCTLSSGKSDWYSSITMTQSEYIPQCGQTIDIFPDTYISENYTITVDTTRQDIKLRVYPFHWESIRFSAEYPLKKNMLFFVDPILDTTHPMISISETRTSSSGESYSVMRFIAGLNTDTPMKKQYHMVQYTLTPTNTHETTLQWYAFYPYYEITFPLNPGIYTAHIDYGFFHPKNETQYLSGEYIPDKEKNRIEGKYGSYHVQTKVIDFSLSSETQ